MADKHDVNHIFQRFETANSVGVQVTPRYGMKKIPLLGIFVGAKVRNIYRLVIYNECGTM